MTRLKHVLNTSVATLAARQVEARIEALHAASSGAINQRALAR